MDPITQGALGAALPQSVSNKEKIKTTTWLGCLAGMAPDIDVFIQSPTDPMLFLEFHRQFTHSFAFIPFGALLCSLIFYKWSKINLTWRQSYLVCLLGYGTHALLDACTTYGTQLFWPFSDLRVAWNTVSVVDPMVSIPLLALVIIASRTGKPLYARLGLAWVLTYLALGLVQRDRAESAGWDLAKARGHDPVSLSAKPGFGAILLWKVIYEANDRYYVDAIRAGFDPQVYTGDSVTKLNISRDLRWLDPESQQANDLSRFAWFSNNYLAFDHKDANMVIDMRYSILPNEIKALWGIRLNPTARKSEHVKYLAQRDSSPDRLQRLWTMLAGQ